VRTIFNFLGPLTNPAGARRQLIGVSDPDMLERMARALATLGVDRALVVSSEDGLDEMSTSGTTRVYEVRSPDEVRSYTVTPADAGLAESPPEAVAGGTPEQNAGDDPRRSWPASPAPMRDLALLNAGRRDLQRAAAPTDIAHGVTVAAEASTRGAAQAALDRYVAATRQESPV